MCSSDLPDSADVEHVTQIANTAGALDAEAALNAGTDPSTPRSAQQWAQDVKEQGGGGEPIPAPYFRLERDTSPGGSSVIAKVVVNRPHDELDAASIPVGKAKPAPASVGKAKQKAPPKSATAVVPPLALIPKRRCLLAQVLLPSRELRARRRPLRPRASSRFPR